MRWMALLAGVPIEIMLIIRIMTTGMVVHRWIFRIHWFSLLKILLILFTFHN